jgi:hypothetical protein
MSEEVIPGLFADGLDEMTPVLRTREDCIRQQLELEHVNEAVRVMVANLMARANISE